MEYDAPDNFVKPSEEEKRRIALYEAGHLVVSEALVPGSVGLASLRSTGRDEMGGFVRRCKDLKRRPHDILIALGGKAAVELYYADAPASGCQKDISRAAEHIRHAILTMVSAALEWLMWKCWISECQRIIIPVSKR